MNVLLSKVLEVASPTAGSALLGPSQIQSLQAAQEITVRTMSAHGESCDSFPVNVPSKLAAVMAGPIPAAPVVPHLPSTSVTPNTLLPPPSYGNSAAKVSVLPNTLPSGSQQAAATLPHALHSQDRLSSASYMKAWADPAFAAALTVCEATLPVASPIPPVVILPLTSLDRVGIKSVTVQVFVIPMLIQPVGLQLNFKRRSRRSVICQTSTFLQRLL